MGTETVKTDTQQHVIQRTTTDATYHSGIAEEIMFEYLASGNASKRIVGSLSIEHLTANNVVVKVYEMIDGAGYICIDSKSYLCTAGAQDPSPHVDYETFRSTKITFTKDVTEGADRLIHRSIDVIQVAV